MEKWDNPTRMQKLKYIITILLLVSLLPINAWAEKPKRNVLYLNSYHNGYQWSDTILNGVRSVLDESPYKIDLQIEYMDAKRYNYDYVTGMLLRLYKEKFTEGQFDVVMVSDNDAFTFARQYRDELFPNVPIVFCGVNDLKDNWLEQGNITGVVENFDLLLTLDVALKIHPTKRRMIVVGDGSTAGLAIRRQIETAVPLFGDQLEVEYWIDLPLKTIQERVEALPKDSFLFFIPYYQTVGSRFFTAEEVMQSIYYYSRAPIYTAWEFLLGYGAVGGRLLSGYQHGQTAASMALKILGGESADAIPIYTTPTGEYAFDFNAMQRLDIPEDRLPEGSRVINAPNPFYELSKELFWTIIISLILLFIIMIFLIFTMMERRRVERKIVDQLAFQQTLMDTVPQLVSWKDIDGKYLGTNCAFADFFGFKDGDDVVNKAASGVIRDQEHVQWAKKADAAVINENMKFSKVRRKLTDGKGNQAWLLINKAPIKDQSGQVVGILSTAENVTKERNLEKQLLQSQKMEAIGTLAGGIAHDFNNILTSIINSTELAVGDVDEDSVTEKDLKRVLKAARRGGRVVKQILAFSRPSTEGFRPTDVGAVVVETLGLMEASMPGNIEVRSDIEPDLPHVHADPTQIHQIAMNLCTNAFHALRESGGGTIAAQVERAILEDEDADLLGIEPGNYVRMTFRDDGPGIPAEIVDKIFDPFFSTKDKTEGTGLGLAVVHGIVRSHKGGLTVQPRTGGGTEFEIYMPIVDGEQYAISDASGKAHLAGANILFVEDDEDQIHTTPRLLETMGFSVTAIRHPEEAAIRIRGMAHRFDLVITDYDMPGLSGTQLAEQVLEADPQLPVILVSGREDAAMAAAHLPNVRKVIIKPYDKNDLSAAIGNVLSDDV